MTKPRLKIGEPPPKPEPDYRAEMRLPEGKTCGDCVHCSRCCAIFGHVPEDTSCDWWPSRYIGVAA
jgi:hypothetical protein